MKQTKFYTESRIRQQLLLSQLRDFYLLTDALEDFIHGDGIRDILGLLTSKSKMHTLLVSNAHELQAVNKQVRHAHFLG